MSGGSSGAAAAAGARVSRASRSATRKPPPLEHRMLLTAALCLLAFGAVMVYSASSPEGVLSGHGGTGTSEFVRYLIFGALGLVAMQVLAKRGLSLLTSKTTTLLLAGSFALTLFVLVPGLGVRINGARRWFAAGRR